MPKQHEPIVITGLGAVSPCGLGAEAVWSALEKGERRGEVTEQGAPGEQPVQCLKVGEWRPADLLGKRGLQYLRPSTQFLLGASVLAVREAGLADGVAQPDDLGITIGCNLVGLQSISDYDYTAVKEGPQYVSPMEAPNTLANAPASHLAIRLKARAFNTTIATGQCAGLDTLGYAAKALYESRARQVVAGAVEELSSAALWVYRNSQVLPLERLEDVGRPFDPLSSGWLPGEGAAVLVLERQNEALERGAHPLAELAGWSSGFAPLQTTEKRASVLVRVARQALAVAGLTPADVDVVVSGANGLQAQDQAEALALRDLLPKQSGVCVTAVKGTLGETYGASGLFQALAATSIINRGIVPPTIGGDRQQEAAVNISTDARNWFGSKQGTVLLLAQDLFGSTSAVVLRGCQ
ncbi:beta-ketoacyl-[acyl-carrier-protein] synthase family protein [Dictyobacter formicarum]|uniref:Beta-ketoacyl-[acyl-carrier-protein] synthase II n=1 Tax=Dictyobacter formicarum TaxID=2778368 RepID=A0ABQ3VTB7_9CHLR|nr:beta-ketoacyl synthase N-terminal-like domain-containing protein [Dictyobacter formicarum]GHO89522.1 beta-ketoacyl-[acyl-carrier-protein] synthase II [Dictyobacter formicarum]